MARLFTAKDQINYPGSPDTNPIQICNGGKVVALTFDWAALGASSAKPNMNVRVSLAPPSNRGVLLKQIASVYIDNTNSPVPIYVYCADTKYCAVSQPNSAGWYPLYTNQQEIWVIGQGFTTGSIPLTTVFISDLFIPPYTDQEIQSASPTLLASANISRGGILFNKNYGIPSLGDQTATLNQTLNTPGSVVNIAFFPTTGFIYLNQVEVVIVAGATVNTAVFCQVRLVNASIGNAFIWGWEWIDVGSGYSLSPPGIKGANLKFDATNNLAMNYSNGSPYLDRFMFVKIVYTTNPQ